MAQKSRKQTHEWMFSILLMSPAFLIVGLGIFLPLVRSVLLAFQDYKLVGANELRGRFIGLTNFISLLKGEEFGNAFLITLRFVFFVVSTELVAGMVAALTLHGGISRRRESSGQILQTLVLLPWVTPTVICALLWAWMFQPQYGLVNFLLIHTGILRSPRSWLADTTLALPSVMVTAVWRDLPLMFLMLFAGLKTIPRDPYEAALIDGAGPFRRFFSITLPYLRNVVRTTVLMAVITNFKQFPLFWTMTAGGPMNRTTSLSVLTYKMAFMNLDFGKAAAVATIWMVGLILFAVVYTRVFKIESGE